MVGCCCVDGFDSFEVTANPVPGTIPVLVFSCSRMLSMKLLLGFSRIIS